MEFATIGGALSSRRKSLNIDQARAASIIGMSRTTFSSYERDLQRPSADVLPSLAQFLEISLDDMLTLYGGTCIEALRPSLERFLATRDADAKDRSLASALGSTVPRDSVSEAVGSDVSPTRSSVGDVGSTGRRDGASHAVDSDVSAAPAPDRDTSLAPVVPGVVPKDVSVSIFANELSDDVPRSQALPSNSAQSEHRDLKEAKGKGGKKKKGKKGKRAKA